MKKLHNWHQTKIGLLIFGLIELAIAYGFASLAIDRGNFLWYLLALIFLVGCLAKSIQVNRKVSTEE